MPIKGNLPSTSQCVKTPYGVTKELDNLSSTLTKIALNCPDLIQEVKIFGRAVERTAVSKLKNRKSQ